MSKRIIINGPSKLKGEVHVQGAKNSAMKLVLLPLLTNDRFVLKNIPQIGSIHNLLKIVQLQGASINWTDDHTVEIDTRKVKQPQTIPADLFYYTSAAVFFFPILASRFGKCRVEVVSKRQDTGGDQLGTRTFDRIFNDLNNMGFKITQRKNLIEVRLVSDKPFVYDVPVASFSSSVIAVICALFKDGQSRITNVSGEAEFDDMVNFLIAAGAKIKKHNDQLTIKGKSSLKGIKYENMPDRHDFVTWLSAALTTNSRLKITGVNYQKMKLDALDSVARQMGLALKFHKDECVIRPQLKRLNPVSMIAGIYPEFITEWQVLFAPLLTQIKGTSRVVECVYENRLSHWEELKKMGAEVEYFFYPNMQPNPRAVRIKGPQSLKGAKVDARDVRTGAALVIAGLASHGTTTIENVDHIHRGYERLVERIQGLGGDIKYSD